MARRQPPSQSFHFPPEFVKALVCEAERDAVLVGEFLIARLKRPICLPKMFLLDLAAVLRMMEWERVGINLHLQAGLPCGSQALDDLMAAAVGHAGPGAEYLKTLRYRLAVLFFQSFAWVAGIELGADVTLEPADGDVFLEGLADFLWACRPGSTDS
jgi:hypothetical protein